MMRIAVRLLEHLRLTHPQGRDMAKAVETASTNRRNREILERLIRQPLTQDQLACPALLVTTGRPVLDGRHSIPSKQEQLRTHDQAVSLRPRLL